MRCLPFAMTRGKLLSQLAQEAAKDPGRHVLCGYCGASMRFTPDRRDQPVRCPGCLRLQRMAAVEEVPWRLTASAADALRRTKRWLRCV
jgi:hypothetical protein